MHILLSTILGGQEYVVNRTGWFRFNVHQKKKIER